MLKKENGITLIALVITIIVLLILAGVSISMVVGDNGIATRAQDASKDTELANAKEALEIAIDEAQTEYYAAWADPDEEDMDLPTMATIDTAYLDDYTLDFDTDIAADTSTGKYPATLTGTMTSDDDADKVFNVTVTVSETSGMISDVEVSE